MKNLDNLFKKLECGEAVSFIDIMAAINDISDANCDGVYSLQDAPESKKSNQLVVQYPCLRDCPSC